MRAERVLSTRGNPQLGFGDLGGRRATPEAEARGLVAGAFWGTRRAHGTSVSAQGTGFVRVRCANASAGAAAVRAGVRIASFVCAAGRPASGGRPCGVGRGPCGAAPPSARGAETAHPCACYAPSGRASRSSRAASPGRAVGCGPATGSTEAALSVRAGSRHTAASAVVHAASTQLYPVSPGVVVDGPSRTACQTKNHDQPPPQSVLGHRHLFSALSGRRLRESHALDVPMVGVPDD